MPTKSAFQSIILDGGIMMAGLVPLAFLCVGFAVQGFINLRRSRVCPRGFSRTLPQQVAGKNREQVIQWLEQQGHSMAMILQRVLRHLEFRTEADPAEILLDEIEEECALLRQKNNQLGVIYHLGPLMGLLGTVIGMISTFRKFSSATEPSIQELGEGIFMALINTAWGVAVAIPAFFFLYLFTRRVLFYEQETLPREGTPALHTILRSLGMERESSTAVPLRPREPVR